MSFFTRLHRLITSTPEQDKRSEHISHAAVARKIFDYLSDLVNEKKSIRGIRKQYEEIKNLSEQQQETALLSLYFDLEDFILKQKPPVIKKLFSKEDLREEVEKNIPLETMGELFQLIFLPKLEQFLFLFENALNPLIDAEKRYMSISHVKEIVSIQTKGTILEGILTQEDELNIQALKRKVQMVPIEDLAAACQSLYRLIYEDLGRGFDANIAYNAAKEGYEWMKTRYHDKVIMLRFFDGIPEDILESERLVLLSRAILKTEVEERTREVEKKEKYLEAIISSIGEGIIVIDKNFVITLINPGATKILSMLPSELLGKNIFNALPVSKDGRMLSHDTHPIFLALTNKNIVVGELGENYAYEISKQSKFPITLIVTPIFMMDAFSGEVIVFRDITEVKKFEDARTNFISVASHQLRTPLTSMRWFLEMLLAKDAGAINEDQKHFITRVYEGTDRMINLVNLLLQIARVEAGRIKIEPISLNIKEVVQEVCALFKSTFDQKSQHVDITTNPDPFPPIAIDKDIIWQVFQNLISNANRYASEKSTIFISILKKEDVIEVAVKDSGIGIPSEQQSRMYEKFFRADNALRLVPEGSGLGLALVKSLVEGWGGKLWFESEENKGTTFYFTIPLQGMTAKEGEVKINV
jgi:PAS domain S-box-containing protein